MKNSLPPYILIFLIICLGLFLYFYFKSNPEIEVTKELKKDLVPDVEKIETDNKLKDTSIVLVKDSKDNLTKKHIELKDSTGNVKVKFDVTVKDSVLNFSNIFHKELETVKTFVDTLLVHTKETIKPAFYENEWFYSTIIALALLIAMVLK